MKVTIKQIAEQVGVSPSTVSRVLSGRGERLISEQTRQRVLRAAEELGYQPHLGARSLVTGRTCTVALWMSQLFTAFHARIVHLMETTLWRSGYELLIRQVGHQTEPPRHGWGRVDGIIGFECVGALRSVRKISYRRPLPVVSMGAYYLTDVDYVGVDLYTGTAQAVKHLIEQGCRRVAYLVNAESRHPGDARRDAYDAVVEAAGLPKEYIVSVDQSRSAAMAAVAAHVEQFGLPDGIFCHNDEMALGAYRVLRLLGVRVPEEVALVGCDGIEDTEYLEVPLSTVRQPLEEMCRLACEFLQRRMAQPDAPLQSAVLLPQLMVRESSLRRR
jgi:DNA-binding LacI/PurR family transcriptional regulator